MIMWFGFDCKDDQSKLVVQNDKLTADKYAE